MAERYALNDLQQTVLDILAESGPHKPIEVDKLIERVSAVPGMDDVNGNHMGPCLSALKRRELVFQLGKGGPCNITAEGLGYVDGWGEAMPEAAPDVEPYPNPDEVTEPKPESAPADEPTPEDPPPICSCGAVLNADEVEYYHYQCEACVRRDHEAMDPAADDDAGECLGGLHYPPGAETLREGSAPDRIEYVDDHTGDTPAPAVTPLSVAIHPPGTNHRHEAAILVSVEDEGAGPYLLISGKEGSPGIDDLATLQAVYREGARLLSQAKAREDACQGS